MFKLPVEVSINSNLLKVEELNVFKLPVEVSNNPNLVFAEDVNVFKLPVEVSNNPNLVLVDCENAFKSVNCKDDDITLSPPANNIFDSLPFLPAFQ